MNSVLELTSWPTSQLPAYFERGTRQASCGKSCSKTSDGKCRNWSRPTTWPDVPPTGLNWRCAEKETNTRKNKPKQNKNRAATKPTTKPNKEPRLKIIMGGVPIIHVVSSVNEEFSTLMTEGRRIRLCQVCPQLFWDWILPFKDDVKPTSAAAPTPMAVTTALQGRMLRAMPSLYTCSLAPAGPMLTEIGHKRTRRIKTTNSTNGGNIPNHRTSRVFKTTRDPKVVTQLDNTCSKSHCAVAQLDLLTIMRTQPRNTEKIGFVAKRAPGRTNWAVPSATPRRARSCQPNAMNTVATNPSFNDFKQLRITQIKSWVNGNVNRNTTVPPSSELLWNATVTTEKIEKNFAAATTTTLNSFTKSTLQKITATNFRTTPTRQAASEISPNTIKSFHSGLGSFCFLEHPFGDLAIPLGGAGVLITFDKMDGRSARMLIPNWRNSIGTLANSVWSLASLMYRLRDVSDPQRPRCFTSKTVRRLVRMSWVAPPWRRVYRQLFKCSRFIIFWAKANWSTNIEWGWDHKLSSGSRPAISW